MPLNPIIGRATPGGARALGIPAGGPRSRSGIADAGPLPRHSRGSNHSSKKSYRGTLAGIGRGGRKALQPAHGRALGVTHSVHPQGPARAGFQSVQLPNRTKLSDIPKASRPRLTTAAIRRFKAFTRRGK